MCVCVCVLFVLCCVALRSLTEISLSLSLSFQQQTTNAEDYTRSTLRQTQVLVIPANNDLNDSFAVFDRLIQVINEARRNARDYVTDYSLEKLDDKMYGGGSSAADRDWV